MTISWPVDVSSGKRSTTGTSKYIWAEIAAAVDKSLVDDISGCKAWRQLYQDEIWKINLRGYRSNESLINMAQAGLKSLYEKFVVTEDGQDYVISSYLEKEYSLEIESETVEGTNADQVFKIPELASIQYLEQCVNLQYAERDVLERLSNFYNDLDAETLPMMKQSTCFVMLGATSELCPLVPLLNLGFDVAAVSRAKEVNQEKLKGLARKSSGRLFLPKLGKYDTTGADVMNDFELICQWLIGLLPGKRLIIGNYIYLDGARNVQACLAMDFIFKKVSGFREVGLAFLGSPSVPLPISEEAMAASRQAFQQRGYSDMFLSAVFGPFKQNRIEVIESEEVDVPLLNGIVNMQGPSYCLAKSMQVWRTIVCCHEACFVSYNLCPPCSTESVFHVKSAARGLRGMKKRFAPLTYFEPVDGRDVMCALLLSDIFYERDLSTRSAVQVLKSTAVHGGAWRSAYDISSISVAAYLYGIF